MSEIHEAISKLEERLLGTWTRQPAFRAAWSPNGLDFFTLRGQLVARACAVVAGAGLSGDDLGVAVVTQLAQSGDLSRSWSLGEAVVSHDNLTDPIQGLDRWRELRSLQALLTGVAKAVSGAGSTTNLSELRGQLHEALAASQLQSAVKAYSDSALIELAYEAATTKHVERYSTGFPELDEVTGELRPGHVWALGAPTNFGKSSFLLAILDHCQQRGRRALMITCEDAPELLASRLLCRRAKLHGEDIRDGKLTRHAERHERALNERIEAAKRGPEPVMLDGRGRNVEHLAGDIRAAIRAHGIGVILVDYLQAIGTSRNTQDRRAEINHVTRQLTDAIKTSGAAGVLASQLTGEDLRESRDIEHGAEVVLIGRKSDDGTLNLFIKKNKTGSKDVAIPLEMLKLNGSFVTTEATSTTGDLTEGFEDYTGGRAFSPHWEDR